MHKRLPEECEKYVKPKLTVKQNDKIYMSQC